MALYNYSLKPNHGPGAYVDTATETFAPEVAPANGAYANFLLSELSRGGTPSRIEMHYKNTGDAITRVTTIFPSDHADFQPALLYTGATWFIRSYSGKKTNAQLAIDI